MKGVQKQLSSSLLQCVVDTAHGVLQNTVDGPAADLVLLQARFPAPAAAGTLSSIFLENLLWIFRYFTDKKI